MNLLRDEIIRACSVLKKSTYQFSNFIELVFSTDSVSVKSMNDFSQVYSTTENESHAIGRFLIDGEKLKSLCGFNWTGAKITNTDDVLVFALADGSTIKLRSAENMIYPDFFSSSSNAVSFKIDSSFIIKSLESIWHHSAFKKYPNLDGIFLGVKEKTFDIFCGAPTEFGVSSTGIEVGSDIEKVYMLPLESYRTLKNCISGDVSVSMCGKFIEFSGCNYKLSINSMVMGMKSPFFYRKLTEKNLDYHIGGCDIEVPSLLSAVSSVIGIGDSNDVVSVCEDGTVSNASKSIVFNIKVNGTIPKKITFIPSNLQRNLSSLKVDSKFVRFDFHQYNNRKWISFADNVSKNFLVGVTD